MFRGVALVLGCSLLASPPAAARAAATLYASYDAYIADLHAVHAAIKLDIGPSNYALQLEYHTTGVVGFFYPGHQLNTVTGHWSNGDAEPEVFEAAGEWRGGGERETLIDYDHGLPVVRRLIPPQDVEREAVPQALQDNTIDTLSALAELIRQATDTGRCDLSIRTFGGRRTVQIDARTAGTEMLPVTGRARYGGAALRCDFVGKLLAGFKLNDDGRAAHRPLTGSAWLAPVMPGAPLVPIRIRFETRWFADVTMFLTGVTPRHRSETPVSARAADR